MSIHLYIRVATTVLLLFLLLNICLTVIFTLLFLFSCFLKIVHSTHITSRSIKHAPMNLYENSCHPPKCILCPLSNYVKIFIEFDVHLFFHTIKWKNISNFPHLFTFVLCTNWPFDSLVASNSKMVTKMTLKRNNWELSSESSLEPIFSDTLTLT